MNYNSRLITLAFLRVSEGEPYMNRLTAFVSKHPVFHVELGFENNKFFSIMYGTHAMLRDRTLKNENYELFSIHVSNEQYKKCYHYCESISSRQNVFFDNFGMWCIFLLKCLPCFINDTVPIHEIKSTFCSKIITHILKEIELEEVRMLSPSVTTPSDLYEVFKLSCHNVVPSTRFNNLDFKLQIPK